MKVAEICFRASLLFASLALFAGGYAIGDYMAMLVGFVGLTLLWS